MTDRTDSPVPSSASQQSDPRSGPAPNSGVISSEIHTLLPPRSLPERIFLSGDSVRLGWRIGLFFTVFAAIVFVLGWLGDSIFRNPHGPALLWQELWSEVSFLVAAFSSAMLLAHIEHRRIDDYALPRTKAFGRKFWVGTVWGFCSITLLLLLMDGARVFSFGSITLHGARIGRFALFWGIYFLVVGLVEEFAIRGYLLTSISEKWGFWPTAIALSVFFGAIHLANEGETLVGALGAAVIGLFFCLTLRRTGSLWFAVGFHAAWDWGETYFYGVPDSGTVEPGHLFSPVIHGKRWLTGGSVGPEASVLLLVVMAAVWIAFHLRYRQAQYPAQSTEPPTMSVVASS